MTIESLITPISVLLYSIAAVAFLAATVNAVRNYRQTKGISNYWMMFAIAVGLGATLSAVGALQHLGIATEILDELDRWVALMFIFSLIMTSVETLTTQIDVTIE